MRATANSCHNRACCVVVLVVGLLQKCEESGVSQSHGAEYASTNRARWPGPLFNASHTQPCLRYGLSLLSARHAKMQRHPRRL